MPSNIAPAPHIDFKTRHAEGLKIVSNIMHLAVLVLSVILIVYMSIETFSQTDFLENNDYMTFQLWVCVVFILDFFWDWFMAERKWRYFFHRIFFLVVSIPYLNIITQYNISLSHDALYFIHFIPLMRGALAMSIVIGYLSSNAVTSLFMSYLSILLLVVYFCSLIFFQREYGANPQVDTYWTALWWSAMNVATVGCNIDPVTVAGKIVAVVLPVCGVIIFPLFTVYLTDFVRRNSLKINITSKSDTSKSSTPAGPAQ